MEKMFEEAQRSIYPAAFPYVEKLERLAKTVVFGFELKDDETINAYASGDNEITFYTGLINKGRIQDGTCI